MNFKKEQVVEKIISYQPKRTTLNTINYVYPFPAPIIIAFLYRIFYFYCLKGSHCSGNNFVPWIDFDRPRPLSVSFERLSIISKNISALFQVDER